MKEAPWSADIHGLAPALRSELSLASSPEERERISGRLLEPYLRKLETEPDGSRRAELAEQLLFVHEGSSFDASALAQMAAIAKDWGDVAVFRRVLDRLAVDDDADVKTRALESLGQLFEELGDSSAAVAAWKIAARVRDDGPGLYERVLGASPRDREAAERLVELRAEAGEWDRVPEVLGIVIRANEDRGAELVLRLEPLALRAGALEPFIAMTEEALALRAPTSELTRRLRRAEARARAAAPEGRARASASYRDLVETFQNDDDAREYESFATRAKDTQEGHLDRRWILRWRAAHVGLTAEELRDWATAEEDRGEAEEAVGVYRRLVGVAVRTDRPGVWLKLFQLQSELGRAEAALVSLASALAFVPPVEHAHAIARALIADVKSGAVTADRLERIANHADDATALRLFEFLASARNETAAMRCARRQWYRRLVELGGGAVDLALILRGAVELPDELLLWDAAERIGRARGELVAVAHAYVDAIATSEIDALLADALGRRMVALEQESLVPGAVVVAALETILERNPRARWALDRVKVGYCAEGRWDALFRFYDGAIDAAATEDERRELLDEAGFVARDLACDAERAIRYFETIHASTPDDAAVALTLERLYERRGDVAALVALLDERIAKSSGLARRDLQRRVVVVWLCSGLMDQAARALESMLDDGASVESVVDLLERVACASRQGRTLVRLSQHYESLDRFDDLVRIITTAIDGAANAHERAHHVRELVRVRVAAAGGAPDVFVRVMVELAADVGRDATRAKVAYRALLVRALAAWKRAPTDAEFDDAAEGAQRAIEALKAIYVDANDPTGAARLLERAARLRFDRRRQRAILREAARMWDERIGDVARATRLLAETFQDDGDDPDAPASFDRFVFLLEASRQDVKLASVWEERARREARAGRESEERACATRAGALWERIGDSERATAAYARSAELGSEDSYEGLARIHANAGRWKEAAAALEWLFAHCPADLRGRRALRLADAHVELGDRPRARAFVDDVVRSAPELAGELRAKRIELHRRDGDARLLAEMLAEEALSTRGRAASALLCEAANVRASTLDEPAAAVRLLELAIAAHPGDASAGLQLAEVLEALGEWERVADVLLAHVAAGDGPRSPAGAAVRQRLAHALLRLGRTEEALAQLRVAAKIDPTHVGVLRDLGRLAYDSGDLAAAERAYRAMLLGLRRRADRSETDARGQVYLALATIARARGDAPRTESLLESALDVTIEDGGDPAPVEEALGRLGRHDLIVRIAEWRIARATDVTERALALRDLTSSWSENLGREPELATRIRRHAVAIGRALDDEGDSTSADDAWTALFSVHATLADEAMMHDVVEHRIAAMRRAGEADRPRTRAWLLETASRAVGMGHLSLVSTIHSALLAADRSDRDVWSAVVGIAERMPNAEGLVTLLEGAIARMVGGPERAQLRVILGRILSERPGRVDAAITHLAGALDDDPSDVETVDVLANVFHREGRFDEEATLLERRLCALAREAPAHTQVAWRLGRALERAGRPADARALYASILDGIEGRSPDREVVCVLAERLEAVGSERLADCLELWIALDPELARSLSPRLVELREAQRDPEGLLRALELSLASDPANRACLDRTLPIYEARGDLAALVRVLRRAALAAPTDRSLLIRLVEAHRGIDADAESLPLLDAAILCGAGDVELLLLRASARARVGDLEGAVSDVEASGPPQGDGWDRRIDILETVARRSARATADAYAMRLADALVNAGRAADAAREIEALLARTPDHSAALERAAALAVEANDWARAAGLYARLLRAVEATPERRADRRSRAVLAFADACARLARPGDAREALERALAERPEDADVAARLEHVCEVTGSWRRLAELLVSRGERHAQAASKTTLLLRAASLLASELGSPTESLAVAELARSASPKSIEAALACARLHMTLAAPREALTVLEAAIERNRGRRSPLLAEVRLDAAKAHLALDELVEALEALKAGFAIDVRNRELAMLLGLVALDLGEERTAERALLAVTGFAHRDAGYPDEVTAADARSAYSHLASMARARGEKTKARELAAKAGGDETPSCFEKHLLAAGGQRR